MHIFALLWTAMVISGLSLSTRAAETVVLPAPLSSNIEYRAFLRSNPEFLSPIQVYRNQHPAAAARERLLALFSEAQKAFVSRSSREAERLFREIADRLDDEDWGSIERRILTASFLRLAQMETKADWRDRWLQQVLLLGPKIDADRSLFPPPLFERLSQLDHQLQDMDLGAHLEEWNLLLVNGIPCTRLDCPRFPRVSAGRLRLTYLADKWLPQTRTVDLSATTAPWPKPERLPWIDGTCGHETYYERALTFTNRQAFFALTCEEGANQNLALAPRTSTDRAPFTQGPPPAPKLTKFYQSKWFWVGAGVVTAATVAILAQQHKSQEERQPTVTYGN